MVLAGFVPLPLPFLDAASVAVAFASFSQVTALGALVFLSPHCLQLFSGDVVVEATTLKLALT